MLKIYTVYVTEEVNDMHVATISHIHMPAILVMAIQIKQVSYPLRYHNHNHTRIHIHNKTVTVEFHNTVHTLPEKCLLSKIPYGFMEARQMDGRSSRPHLHTRRFYWYTYLFLH
jgi:hypothetical protein